MTEPSTNFAGLFGGSDADETLAKALERSLIQLNRNALREALFIRFYLGEAEAEPLLSYIMAMKFHQSPGAIRKLVDAIKARSLYDMLSAQYKNMNIGGKS